MKKAILTLLLLGLLPFTSYCQQLSLENLISIYNKEIDEVDETLKAKGWEYHGKDDENEDGITRLTWAMGLNEYTERASAWIHLNYLNQSFFCVSYSASKPTIDLIRNRVLALKMQKVASGVSDNGAIYSIYTVSYTHLTLPTILLV